MNFGRGRQGGQPAPNRSACVIDISLVRAELDEQQAAALGQELAVHRAACSSAKRIDDHGRRSPRGRSACSVRISGTSSAARNGVGKAEHDQAPERRALDEPERRLEHGDAGALAADQRARDVEAVLGQQLVEVVAGDAARDAAGTSRG